MQPKCETCKWWGGPVDYPKAVPVDERFEDGALPDGKRYCALTYTYRGQSRRPTLAESFGIPDGILCTAPDFGCVQHEPNDAVSVDVGGGSA